MKRMYFAYIDESGKPDLSHSQNEFVISAFIIHEKDWFNIQKACDELKHEIWKIIGKTEDIPEDFQIHIKEINNNENHYKQISIQQKTKILKKIYKTISDLPATIISVIILKEQVQNHLDINDIAFKLLFEKLQNFMTIKNPDLDEYLLLILDRVSPQFDDTQRQMIESFVKYGVKRTKNRKRQDISSIIETPFFVSSSLHNGVQFSDAVAFIIRRYVHIYIEERSRTYWDTHVEEFFKPIGKLFFRDANNRVCENGVKIYPYNFENHKTLWKLF